MKSFIGIVLVMHLAGSLYAADQLTLASPNDRIQVRIIPSSSDSNEAPRFQVSYAGQQLLFGSLALKGQGENLLQNAVILDAGTSVSDTTSQIPFHKSNPVRDHYRELTVKAHHKSGPLRDVLLIFRAYDDGVAYRYVIPKQAGIELVEINDESGTFGFAEDPLLWPLYLTGYNTSHEGNYESVRFSALSTNRLMDVPLLAEFGNGVSLAIAQAALRNYAGMYLKAEGVGPGRQLRSSLPSLPKSPTVKVRSSLPLVSPWRAFLIGDSPGRLVESSLLLNLNEPNAIGDISWLKPGKATFYWWSGVQSPVDVQKSFEWEKKFIDFAAQNGFAFHAVIGTDGDRPWYHQTTNGYYPPGLDADVTRVRENFPMSRVVDYARSKGVGIRLWVPIVALKDRLEQAFAQYQDWGIAGLMVDFLDRDDQEMVLLAEEVLKSAAKHHLHIQFHGVWAPTGLHRTYPNLLNHEGVLNLEYLKWSDRCSPEHNLTVPFTRMLAGPMDYHSGGFRSVRRELFKPRHIRPVVLGTRAHHLAMYVVYENPMPMVADHQEAYADQPGFDFIKRVPTDWDESAVIQARVGDYIVISRRKGVEWFIGAMTDWTPRQLEVSLGFLPEGQFEAVIWADTQNRNDPNQLTVKNQALNSRSKISMKLAEGGGQVVWLKPRTVSLPR